ncbi:hypothetical protein DNR41_27370, partial [Escherichia coli]
GAPKRVKTPFFSGVSGAKTEGGYLPFPHAAPSPGGGGKEKKKVFVWGGERLWCPPRGKEKKRGDLCFR